MRLAVAGSQILISRVGQALANAAVIMVVAKTLGPEGQGHYSLTAAVVLLLASLLGGGMGLAAVPPLRQGRVPPLRMLTAQSLWAGGMFLVMGLAAWAALGPRTASFLQAHLGWFPGLGFAAAVAAAAILTFETLSYNLLARGRLVAGAAVNGGRAAGHFLVVAALGWFGTMTFGRAVGAFALAQACGAAVMLLLVVRELRRPLATVPPAAAAPALPVPGAEAELPADLAERSLFGLIAFNLRRGWLGQISAVAYFLLLRLDQGLLEHYRGAAEVGIYSIAVHVGEMLWLLPGALTPLLVHSSATAAGHPDRDPTALRAVRWGLGLTLLAAIPLFLLARPLSTLLAGGEFAASGDALRTLLPGIVAFAPGAVLAGDFIGRGRPHWNTQASVLTVLVNVVCGVILIPRHGAVGAGWASTIAYACGSILMIARFQRTTGLRVWGRNGPRQG